MTSEQAMRKAVSLLARAEDNTKLGGDLDRAEVLIKAAHEYLLLAQVMRSPTSGRGV